jgi:hypothetical protein
MVWSAGTADSGTKPFYLKNDCSGYIKLFDNNNKEIWKRGNSGLNGPGYLMVSNDGNLIFYDKKNNKVWESGSSQKETVTSIAITKIEVNSQDNIDVNCGTSIAESDTVINRGVDTMTVT